MSGSIGVTTCYHNLEIEMKIRTQDNLIAAGMVSVGVALTVGIMITSAGMASRMTGPNTWTECVNKVAYQAYVEDDMDNDFDSGFDAGLYAAKVCGVEK